MALKTTENFNTFVPVSAILIKGQNDTADWNLHIKNSTFLTLNSTFSSKKYLSRLEEKSKNEVKSFTCLSYHSTPSGGGAQTQ